MTFFADELSRFGSNLALIDEAQNTITYTDLAHRIDVLSEEIGSDRQLIFLEAENNVASVVSIFACLRGRHPIIIGSAAARDRIEAAFQPNIVIGASGELSRLSNRKIDLHPDLALMLSTSGSTGATKLVRLSREAVHANASSIADYLGIGEDDRAITTLPISYSYGLSVLNSHLLAGASVVLTNRSVVDDDLWTLFDATEATSIAGVPYTYELLEATGFRERTPGSLRTMTQAGGRLSPDLVETYHRWAEDQGVSFYTMYGQTEATARMAYLAPHEMEGHMDCIGRAIPNGNIRLVDEDGNPVRPGEKGELVYAGPNVMMGYATGVEELARGSELTELRTGDLAQEVDEGLFRIVGRVSRFSKIAGLRVSLDEIERLLGQKGIKAVVAGNDTLVAIAIADPAQVAEAERLVEMQTSIPLRSRVIFALEETPRLISGKIDYPAVLRAGQAAMAQAERTNIAVSGMSELAAVYARALNRPSVDAGDSFSSLAGDSLAYIEVSMAIERTLGTLPDHWEQLTIGQLEAMSDPHAANGPLHFRAVSTEMLIRPVAMTMIITGHITAQGGGVGEVWKGGALALLMTAGYNATRFQRDRLISSERWQLIVQFFWRFMLLYYLLIAVKAVLPGERDIGWWTPFMLNSYLRSETASDFDRYWFLEALFHLLILTVILFSIPAIRNFAIKHRWWFALGALAVATAFKFITPFFLSPEANELTHRLDSWAYAYALGFAVADAHSPGRKLFCIAAACLLSGLDWGFIDLHTVFLTGAVVLILYIPRVRLWAPLAVGAAFFAQSTFYIYLSHGFSTRLFFMAHIYDPLIVVPAALGIGMIGYVVWRTVERQAIQWLHYARRERPQHLATDL